MPVLSGSPQRCEVLVLTQTEQLDLTHKLSEHLQSVRRAAPALPVVQYSEIELEGLLVAVEDRTMFP